jgi:hypothetical protein
MALNGEQSMRPPAASSRFDCVVLPKLPGRTNVDDKQHGQLALFRELLHERGAEPRGHVPVDRADLVAGLILAHFVEVHPAPLKTLW